MTQRRAPRVVAAAAAFLLVAAAAPTRTALTCEQLFTVVESAVQLRDQGYSLQQVLAGLKGAEIEGKLATADIQVLRKSVTAVYLGDASAEEVALACKQAQARK